MSAIENPKFIYILIFIAIGSSGFNIVNSTDEEDIRRLESELKEAIREMDTKVQMEFRLISAPLDTEVRNLKDSELVNRERVNQLEKDVATLLERTRT